MEWRPGTLYSVRLKGEADARLLQYRFGASLGGQFAGELSSSLFFTDSTGARFECQAHQIASVVGITPDAEIVVDVSNPDAIRVDTAETLTPIPADSD